MSLEQKKVDNNYDLYAFLEGNNSNVMETPKKITAREKKLNQLANKFGDLSSQAKNGFLMGAAVGGSMGAMIGLWSALQTRRLILLPISIITSGGFFGFMMMCGSIIRTDTENIYQRKSTQSEISYNMNSSNIYRGNEFWKIKYSDPNTNN